MNQANGVLRCGPISYPGSVPHRTGNSLPLSLRRFCRRTKIPHRGRLLSLAITGLLTMLLLPVSSLAFEIRQAGKLQVSHDAQLFAFSTDPTIQEILSQDLSA